MESAVRALLANLLLAATLLFGTNVLLVIIGSGVSFEFFGLKIQSILLEFPLLVAIVCGLLWLFLVGKRSEAVLVCISLCVAMLIAEVALRLIDHPLSKVHVDYSTWYRPSEYFGHELIPGFDGLDPLTVPVTINSHGFRDDEHVREKPAGTLRVLGLGDSFTFGWGVSQDETFLKQLERELRVRTGRSVEVINAGVPGWGLSQFDLFLRRDDLNYSPDIIVIAYFVDDLSGPINSGVIGEDPPLIVQQQEVPVKGGILHYSRLFNFMKSVGHWVREKNRRARTAYLHDFDERRKEWSKRSNYLMVKPDDEADTKFKGYLLDYLLDFKRIASERRASLFVMFIPDVAQLYHSETQYINGVLAEMTKELEIPFIDMTQVFETSRDPTTYYLWPKDPHTNARGHLEMAKALLKLICESANRVNVSCNRSG